MVQKGHKYTEIHCPCILHCTVDLVPKYDSIYGEKRDERKYESTKPKSSKLGTWLSHIFVFYSILAYQNTTSRLF
jgi:hypothetical protein